MGESYHLEPRKSKGGPVGMVPGGKFGHPGQSGSSLKVESEPGSVESVRKLSATGMLKSTL